MQIRRHIIITQILSYCFVVVIFIWILVAYHLEHHENEMFTSPNDISFETEHKLFNKTKGMFRGCKGQVDYGIMYRQDFPKLASTGIPLLTLFTTMLDHNKKLLVNVITIRNWSLFSPVVKSVLYLDDMNSSLAVLAKAYGWDVSSVPKNNEYGTPVMKDMFIYTMLHYNSCFYAYANGDILFDSTLYKTLHGLLYGNFKSSTLMVGPRQNLDMSEYYRSHGVDFNKKGADEDILSPQMDGNLSPLWCHGEVDYVANHKAEVYNHDAIDYFILTNHSFPWSQMADVVIGRPGYDNYFVLYAQENHVRVIETQQTIHAIHQTGMRHRLCQPFVCRVCVI